MSDKKEPRKVEEIQVEYQRLCVQLGHTEYQIDALGKDARLLKEQLRDLNLEAAEVAKKAREAAPAAEGKKE